MPTPSPDPTTATAFHTTNPPFSKILGPTPSITLIAKQPTYPQFHEAGVYIPSTASLFITSNAHIPEYSTTKTIKITKVNTRDPSYPCEEIDADVPMANGGVNYGNGVLFCAQGTLERPGGLVVMQQEVPYATTNLIDGFFGRKFNSVNDVVVHSDGSIWFTDPCYGYEQGFRPEPELPCQVYRFDPRTKGVRVVADGFDMPNGICFSPGEETVYVTDTGFVHVGKETGVVDKDLRRPSTM